MATILNDGRVDSVPEPAGRLLQDGYGYLWLGIGTILAFMAVGTRSDIALAAWVAPIFLLRFVRTSRPLVGIAAVWLVSVGCALVCWILLAAPFQASTIALAVYLGTGFTPPYLLDRLLSPRLGTLGRLLLFPTAWATCEFMMGAFSPVGASYGIRALTQTGNLPLLQLLSVTGVYGIGFLIGWFATVVNWVWENSPSHGKARVIVGSFAAALIVTLLGGAARLALAPAPADYVNIAGLTPSKSVMRSVGYAISTRFPYDQPEMATDAKLKEAYVPIMEDLIAGTSEAARAGAKIVVWSELAVRLPASDKPALLAKAAEVAKKEHVYINVTSGTPGLKNEANLIGPDGKIVWNYEKSNPVPGLENLHRGQTPVPVAQTPFGRLTTVICYDANFPTLNRVKADILMVPAFDWPQAGYSHTMKWANLRAIENGYSFFRTDFNGQSAAFDQYGHVLATQDATRGDRNILYADVPVRGVSTFYNMVGDLFAWLCVLAAIGFAGLAIVRPNRVS